ncbi:sialic acid TRAP transporter substrate-binding protein SiaP [Marinimicrococcus flavescens]|uniref:Sialic acid TRAP transporter substrate-binding protein SiaP n=1 Tax=Marinimicrococcus flavescens TaxID=3031815 RepID=A0AAP3XS34_9PROT|nr:sialic acid TRAP transporter substrate-binding protein SiaP [Marinimicrococcus flavescens]
MFSTRTLGIAAGIAGSLLIAGAASAQEQLKFAHVYESSEPYQKWALWAAEQIAERTDGRYTMEVYPASSLGKESDINQGLTLGTVDIIYTGTAFAGNYYGPLAIGGAPYIFSGFDHWQSYKDSELFEELAEGYKEKTGNKIVGMTYYGERHVTANKPIRTPDDMKGLKIRVPDAPLYLMFPKGVGANAAPIAFAEVYLALQTGTVDAQENPLPTILAKKFYEVQDTINLTGHITESLITVIGAPLWNRLSDEDKTIFTEIFKEAAAGATDDVREAEDRLRTEFVTMGETVITDVDRDAFRAALQPSLTGPSATWTKEQYDRLQALAD